MDDNQNFAIKQYPLAGEFNLMPLEYKGHKIAMKRNSNNVPSQIKLMFK